MLRVSGMKGNDMFNDLFDFGKQRTLKQSVGFFMFYACVFLGISTLASMMGLK